MIRIIFFFKVCPVCPNCKNCPFCDEHIPFPLPERIKSYLINLYQLDPKKRITLPIISNLFKNVVDQYEFCRLHEGELKIVPEGREKNYPFIIDFEGLSSRVEELVPELMLIIEGKESYYRKEALNAYETLGKGQARRLIGRSEDIQVI